MEDTAPLGPYQPLSSPSIALDDASTGPDTRRVQQSTIGDHNVNLAMSSTALDRTKNYCRRIRRTLQDWYAVVISRMPRVKEPQSPPLAQNGIVNNAPTQDQEHLGNGHQSRQRDFAANGINCLFLIFLFVGAVHALGCFGLVPISLKYNIVTTLLVILAAALLVESYRSVTKTRDGGANHRNSEHAPLLDPLSFPLSSGSRSSLGTYGTSSSAVSHEVNAHPTVDENEHQHVSPSMALSSAGPSAPMATDGDEDPPKQSLDEDHDQEQVPLAIPATAFQLTFSSGGSARTTAWWLTVLEAARTCALATVDLCIRIFSVHLTLYSELCAAQEETAMGEVKKRLEWEWQASLYWLLGILAVVIPVLGLDPSHISFKLTPFGLQCLLVSGASSGFGLVIVAVLFFRYSGASPEIFMRLASVDIDGPTYFFFAINSRLPLYAVVTSLTALAVFLFDIAIPESMRTVIAIGAFVTLVALLQYIVQVAKWLHRAVIASARYIVQAAAWLHRVVIAFGRVASACADAMLTQLARTYRSLRARSAGGIQALNSSASSNV
ncbi:hypothetical protein PENSPDRAFT_671226 [Peniophora sp. CONT]|nr:hypothetical protein PENSPDRAFT_671226 [Peniophora sp. CONT]